MIDALYPVAALGIGACALGTMVTVWWQRAERRLIAEHDRAIGLAHRLTVAKREASERGRHARRVQIATRHQQVLDKMHELQREIALRRDANVFQMERAA